MNEALYLRNPDGNGPEGLLREAPRDTGEPAS